MESCKYTAAISRDDQREASYYLARGSRVRSRIFVRVMRRTLRAITTLPMYVIAMLNNVFEIIRGNVVSSSASRIVSVD